MSTLRHCSSRYANFIVYVWFSLWAKPTWGDRAESSKSVRISRYGQILAGSMDRDDIKLETKSRRAGPHQLLDQDALSDTSVDHMFLTAEGAAAVRTNAYLRRSLTSRHVTSPSIQESRTARVAEDSKTCEYHGNVTLWWPTGIFDQRRFNDYAASCDVPCVEPASSMECSHKADGVVYHMPQHYGDPEVGRPKQLSIAFSMESTPNYPHQHPTELQNKGYAVATTRPESAVQVLYFDLPSWERLTSSGFQGLPNYESRKPAVAFVARNCAESRRDVVSRFARAAADLGFEVHSLGSCTPAGTKKMHTLEMRSASKHSLLIPYRGYMAFENSVDPGYVTEKVFDGYVAGTVNLYWGAPDVAKHVPPDSLLSFPELTSPPSDAAIKEVAQRMHQVLVNETAWNAMMAWRQIKVSEWEGGAFAKRWGGGWRAHSSCRMCRVACARSQHAACVGKRFDSKTQSLIVDDSTNSS